MLTNTGDSLALELKRGAEKKLEPPIGWNTGTHCPSYWHSHAGLVWEWEFWFQVSVLSCDLGQISLSLINVITHWQCLVWVRFWGRGFPPLLSSPLFTLTYKTYRPLPPPLETSYSSLLPEHPGTVSSLASGILHMLFLLSSTLVPCFLPWLIHILQISAQEWLAQGRLLQFPRISQFFLLHVLRAPWSPQCL